MTPRGSAPKRNMYGCLPCPKCGSEYRWPNQSGEVVCDDCNSTEPYDEYLEETLNDSFKD